MFRFSTPEPRFPPVSRLFPVSANRFPDLAALFRNLHCDRMERMDEALRARIDNPVPKVDLFRIAMPDLGP